MEALAKRWKELRRHDLQVEILGEITGTFLLKGNDDVRLYQWCKEQPEVIMSEYNAELELRTMMNNDPEINSQYYLKLIRAFDAWKVASSGKKIIQKTS